MGTNEIHKRLFRIKDDIEYIEKNLKPGRPKKDYSKVKKAFNKGMTINEVVKKFKISRSIAYKIYKRRKNG